jgi:hypothetical protein
MKSQTADYAWLAANLQSLVTDQPDGKKAFKLFTDTCNYHDMVALLDTYESFDSDVSDIQRSRIVRAAIQSAAQTGDVTAEALIRELSRQKTLYAKKSKSDFVLVTSLSVKRPRELHRLAFDGARFVFSDTLPENFSRTPMKLPEPWAPPIGLPAEFTKVRVAVKARSEFDACTMAVNSLDFLRGMWNFAINRGISWRWSSGPVKPINSVCLGPVHTLHRPTGEPVTDAYWYEPTYPPTLEATKLADWPVLGQEVTDIRKAIRRHPYHGFIREALIRYARSLDGIDHESSFLKFWSLLEWLTAISSDQNYGEVIKRILFLFDDKDYHRKILEHLRLRRNRSVHGGQTVSSALGLIFQINAYVDAMIIAHIKSRGQFRTPQEFGQMLSSPHDPNALTDKLEKLTTELRLLKAAQAVPRK